MHPRIGFIGLGEMGLEMAINISKAGFDLVVFDWIKEHIEKAVSYGASPANSPKDLALISDWIILCLPHTEAVKDVIFGKSGIIEGIHDRTIIIDCGTTHPQVTREIAAFLRGKDVPFLDAPVSGMKARAREGTLTVMVGGEEPVLAKVNKVLAAFSNKIIYMGSPGNGQLTKLVNQLLFNINTAAIAEILPMAVKMGLDPERVCEVARTGTGASFALEFFSPLILKDDFQPGYHMQNAYKDMVSALEISAHERIPLPVTSAATLTYQLALAQGLKEENKGAMIKVWENVLGIKVRKKGDSGNEEKADN
ncbi:MAG: NAD(P)-dependent oxidoreductase [Planctomycetes bacterium]|nr:NAD(P)-dependent oxidoreductase [Planctomycetota bacterium]